MKKTLKTISILYLAFLFIAGWIISFPKQDIILQLTPLPPLLIFIYWIYNKKRQDNMTESPKERDTIRSCVIEFILKVINIICIGYMVVIGHEWTLGVSEPLAYFMPAFPIAFFLSRQFEGKGAKYKIPVAIIFLFWGIICGMLVMDDNNPDGNLWYFDDLSCEGKGYDSSAQWLNCYPLCMLGNFVFFTSVLGGLFSTLFILIVKLGSFFKNLYK